MATLPLNETIRDVGRSLSRLSGDEFIEGFLKALADTLPAFHVGNAVVQDAAEARVGPLLVIATSPIESGEIPADATAVAAYLCSTLDDSHLDEGYERIASVKDLQKSPSSNPSRSTVTLGLIVAATSMIPLDSIAQAMRHLNHRTAPDQRPDMVAVLSSGTVNYLATIGPDQTMPMDWLPPAQGQRDFISPSLLNMVTTATSSFSLNRLVGMIVGQLAFYAPTLQRPNMQAIIEGVPSKRTVAAMYQYDLSGRLVEVEKPKPVASPPFVVESPNKELLGKMFYQPWQDGGIVIFDGRLPLEALLIFAPRAVPTIAIKLKNDRQVSTVLPLSYEDFTEMARQIAKRSNLTVQRQQQEFTIAHIGDEGTSTPFVARLWMTPPHLRDLALHKKEDVDAFDGVYQSVLNDLTTLRRLGRETLELWNKHSERVANGEIVRYQNGIHVEETIDEPLSHNVETIIRNAANAAKQFQDLTRALGVDMGFMFKDDKGFEEGMKALEGSDPMLADYLRETRKWSQPLTLTRNILEHKPYVAPRIQYIRKAGDRFEATELEVLGLPLTAFIPVLLSRVNRFIEEVLIRSLQRSMAAPLTVVEIPISRRDPTKPERFRSGVLGQYVPWQIVYSDDDFNQV